jgi:hypothetical protein
MIRLALAWHQVPLGSQLSDHLSESSPRESVLIVRFACNHLSNSPHLDRIGEMDNDSARGTQLIAWRVTTVDVTLSDADRVTTTVTLSDSNAQMTSSIAWPGMPIAPLSGNRCDLQPTA